MESDRAYRMRTKLCIMIVLKFSRSKQESINWNQQSMEQ